MSTGVFPAGVWQLVMAELSVSDVLRLCDLNPAMDKVGYRVLKAMRDGAFAQPALNVTTWWLRKEAVLMKRLKYHLPFFKLTVSLSKFTPGVLLVNDSQIRVYLGSGEEYHADCRECAPESFSSPSPKYVIQYVIKHQCKK